MTDIYDMDVGFILDMVQTKLNFIATQNENEEEKEQKGKKVHIREATQADIDRL